MQNWFIRMYAALIGILLTVISFFLVMTYNKIEATNLIALELRIELAKIQEQTTRFMTYEDVSILIDKKIDAYHKN